MALQDDQAQFKPNELTRRSFLFSGAAASATVLPLVARGADGKRADAAVAGSVDQDRLLAMTLTVNGSKHALRIDPRTTLLDSLRDHLGLTGTNKTTGGCAQKLSDLFQAVGYAVIEEYAENIPAGSPPGAIGMLYRGKSSLVTARSARR